jgi:hypothetical protein
MHHRSSNDTQIDFAASPPMGGANALPEANREKENTMLSLYTLWGLTGGGIASFVMMALVWSRDPVPFAKYLGIVVTGIVSGLIGGMWMHSLAGSNPMPGIVGAASLSAIVSSGIPSLVSMGVKTAR